MTIHRRFGGFHQLEFHKMLLKKQLSINLICMNGVISQWTLTGYSSANYAFLTGIEKEMFRVHLDDLIVFTVQVCRITLAA